MQSFKEFISAFNKEIKSLFFEMARRTSEDKPRFKVWDEYDRQYYKYIIDHAPDKVKQDDDLLRKLIQQALYWRYGTEERTGILHDPKVESLPAKLDKMFNISGVGKFTIKDIPMHAEQLIKKFDAGKGNWRHPKFGYSVGNWNPIQTVKAPQIVNAIKNGADMPDNEQYYNPAKDFLYVGASQESINKEIEREQRGSNKKRDYEEFQEKSMQSIPLDDEDKKFIEDFKKNFAEQYPTEDVEDYIADAMAFRYSDHFITKTPEGEFVAKPEFGDSVKVPFLLPKKQGHHQIHFRDLYMNLPQLAEKFEKYKKVRDFVKEPLLNHGMTDNAKKVRGRQAARRFIDSGKYGANHATKHTETLYDMEFADQVKKDHDLWIRSKEPVKGNHVDDQKLAQKLSWREGDMIMRSPNIADKKVKYDPDETPWDDIVKNDAKSGVLKAINILNTATNSSKFAEFCKQPKNFDEANSAAWATLTTAKTGIEPEKYLSQKSRINMAANAAMTEFKKLWKNSGEGDAGKDKEDMPSAADSASSRDSGYSGNIQTGKNHWGTDDDDDVSSKNQASFDQEPEPEVKKVKPEFTPDMYHATQEPSNVVLSKPKHIPFRQWVAMNDIQKRQAMGIDAPQVYAVPPEVKQPMGMKHLVRPSNVSKRDWHQMNLAQRIQAMQQSGHDIKDTDTHPLFGGD